MCRRRGTFRQVGALARTAGTKIRGQRLRMSHVPMRRASASFSTAVRQKMGTMLMSDIFHRSLIPSPYRLPERALSYVQYVIINWLDVEVDETAPEWRPLLNDLTGWRRFITICNVLRQIGRRACTGVRRPISRHQAT